MELLGKIILIIHVLAGITTLITGPIAIFFNDRNIRSHRIAGKVFFYAMNVVCVSSIITFVKHPDVAFYQFLLGIAIFVYAGILRGVRAIQIMKGARVYWFDFFYTIVLLLFAFWMIGKGVQNWLNAGQIAISILFLVFGLGSLKDAVDNLKNFRKPQNLQKLDWLKMHVGSMIGAFIASSTAFTVNVAHGLPWFIQWFGPTVLLVPLLVYFSRKIEARKKAEVRKP